MSNRPSTDLVKPSLDKDLEKIVHVEAAARTTGAGVVPHSMALLFLGLSALVAGIYSGVTADAAIETVRVSALHRLISIRPDDGFDVRTGQVAASGGIMR